MTLLTERCLVLRAPKTGGTWLGGALVEAGVRCSPLWTRLGPGSRGHVTRAQARAFDDRWSIAFVRHPLDVYRSRWANSLRTGWAAPRLLSDSAADTFPAFVENVLRRHPGFVSQRFAEFTGPPDDEVRFVGRFERLVDDAVDALRLGGEPFDEVALRAHPRANTSDYEVHRATYDRALAERVVDAEAEAIGRWYADDPLPARFLGRA